MPLDRQQVIEHAEVVRLAGLGHQVGDEDPHRARRPGSRRRCRARAAAAGCSCRGCPGRRRSRRRAAARRSPSCEQRGRSGSSLRRAIVPPARAIVVSPLSTRPSRELRDQRDDLGRGRQHDAARRRASARRSPPPRRSPASRRPAPPAPGCRSRGRSGRRRAPKRYWKTSANPRLVARERRQAVADVARRNHVELRAQPARAAAIVGRRDDGDRAGRASRRVAPFGEEQRAQAAQHVGQPGAAADRDDARRRRPTAVRPGSARPGVRTAASITSPRSPDPATRRTPTCVGIDRREHLAHARAGSPRGNRSRSTGSPRVPMRVERAVLREVAERLRRPVAQAALGDDAVEDRRPGAARSSARTSRCRGSRRPPRPRAIVFDMSTTGPPRTLTFISSSPNGGSARACGNR